MSLAERLKVLVSFEGKLKLLAGKINSSSQTIGQAIKNDGRLRSDTLESIAKAYPQLNMRWLLTGEGESGLDKGNKKVKPLKQDDPEKEELKEKVIQLQESELKYLKREIKAHAPELAKKLEI